MSSHSWIDDVTEDTQIQETITILRWTEYINEDISDRLIPMELEDTSEFAYLRYFQYLKLKDAESAAGLFELRNWIIIQRGKKP